MQRLLENKDVEPAPSGVLTLENFDQVTLPQNVDVLLVLGRGVYDDGTLSETSRQRAEMAARLVEHGLVKTVIFLGGHSWRQEEAAMEEGVQFPHAEGSQMMHHAQNLLEKRQASRVGTRLIADKKSTSTAEHFANGKGIMDYLGFDKETTVGVMSDSLHWGVEPEKWRDGRVAQLGSIALHGMKKVAFRIKNEPELNQGQLAEEEMMTRVTKVAMFGLRRSPKAMVRRHHLIDRLNRFYQRLKPTPDMSQE